MSIIEEIQSILRKKQDVEEYLDTWLILKVEQLNSKIILDINESLRKVINTFDDEFVKLYNSKDVKKLRDILMNIQFDPRIKYKYHSFYKFKTYTIPIQVNNYFRDNPKNILCNVINSVSNFNVNNLKHTISEILYDSFKMGGQYCFNLFDIQKAFKDNINDYESKWLNKYIMDTTERIYESISSVIKFAILQGIRNAESLDKMKNNMIEYLSSDIVNIYNTPTHDKNNDLICSGYNMPISTKYWALIFPETSIMESFEMGKLYSLRQMRACKKVRYEVCDDDKLSPECNDKHGNEYKINGAYGVLPTRPFCKCNFVPVINDYDKVKKKSNKNIQNLYDQTN